MSANRPSPDGPLDPATPVEEDPLVTLEASSGDGSSLGSALVGRLARRGDASSRYDRKGEVARGGQGAILHVRDVDLRRDLAMKVVLASADGSSSGTPGTDSRTLGRFLEEAQVTGQLDHPGIVPVHELGLDADGGVYFTMKLVKGRDLRAIFELVREGAEGWNLTRALGVMLKVCEAMAYAHKKGVIHRDLKPGNVMVGKYGEVYVMDWGLARVLGHEDGKDIRIEPERTTQDVRSDRRGDATDVESPLLTMDGDVVGTPAYMPPEQAAGDLAAMGPHSDVYAVGAMLYHLLAQRMPYVDPGMRINNYAIWYMVQKGPPDPLSELARDVPVELVAICEKAMAREPGERYADMLALAEDLRAFLEHRVVGAYETGTVAELRKWMGRNRPLATAVAAVVVVALAGLATVAGVQRSLNAELATTNSTLRETVSQLEEATGAARRARDEAQSSEREASWLAYVAAIGAANARLDAGAVGDAIERLRSAPEEHRGWEWEYLENRADVSLVTSEVLPGFPFCVAYAPDGLTVAAAGGALGDYGHPDRAVRVFDARTLEIEHVFEGHRTDVFGVDISSSGTELASVSRGEPGVTPGQIRVVDMESGELLGQLEGEGGPRTVDFFPARELAAPRLAIGFQNGEVVEWALDGEPRPVAHLSASLRSVTIARDGEAILVGRADGVVQLMPTTGASTIWELDLSRYCPPEMDHEQGVLDLDLSEDGTRLLAATSGGVVVLADARDGTLLEVFRGHARPATSARFGRGERWVVSAGCDGTVRLWDLDGAELEVLHGHGGVVSALDVGPDGRRIVSGSYDRTVRIWDAQPGSAMTTLRAAGAPTFQHNSLEFGPRGERLAWRVDARTVRVSDARSGLELYTLPIFKDEPSFGFETFGFVRRVAFSPDGSRLLTVGLADRLREWDAGTGELIRTVGNRTFEVGYVDFDFEHARLAACSVPLDGSDTVIGVWSTDLGSMIWSEPVLSLAWKVRFTPDGTRLVTGHSDGSIVVWDAASGARVQEMQAASRTIDLDISPGGDLLATVSYSADDSAVRLWDLRSGEFERALLGKSQPSSVAFGPQGRRLVTGSWHDGLVTLWDLERGEIVSFGGHRGTVHHVAFSAAGRIASVDSNGFLLIRDATPSSERMEPRDRAAYARRTEADLAPRVGRLFDELVLPGDVVAALGEDPSLNERELDAAVRLARNRPFSVDFFVQEPLGRALRTLLDGEASPADHERAGRILRACRDLWPDPDDSRLLAMAGFTHCRLGEYEEALTTLEKVRGMLEAAPVQDFFPVGPRNVAVFQAMAEARLGRVQDAHERLDALRAADEGREWDLPFPDWLEWHRVLLAEVDALLDQ